VLSFFRVFVIGIVRQTSPRLAENIKRKDLALFWSVSYLLRDFRLLSLINTPIILQTGMIGESSRP
jgi:hypothetical protein